MEGERGKGKGLLQQGLVYGMTQCFHSSGVGDALGCLFLSTLFLPIVLVFDVSNKYELGGKMRKERKGGRCPRCMETAIALASIGFAIALPFLRPRPFQQPSFSNFTLIYSVPMPCADLTVGAIRTRQRWAH